MKLLLFRFLTESLTSDTSSYVCIFSRDFNAIELRAKACRSFHSPWWRPHSFSRWESPLNVDNYFFCLIFFFCERVYSMNNFL